jgi:hypothetical protein
MVLDPWQRKRTDATYAAGNSCLVITPNNVKFIFHSITALSLVIPYGVPRGIPRIWPGGMHIFG